MAERTFVLPSAVFECHLPPFSLSPFFSFPSFSFPSFPVTIVSYLNSVIIIFRNLTFENFNSGKRRSRNFYIPQPFHPEKHSVADQRGSPGSAMELLSLFNGAAAALQRQPRCRAVRPLRLNKTAQEVAHFGLFRHNYLLFRR